MGVKRRKFRCDVEGEPYRIDIPEAPRYRKTPEGYRITHSRFRPATFRRGTEEEARECSLRNREYYPGDDSMGYSSFGANIALHPDRDYEITSFTDKLPSSSHLHELGHAIDKTSDERYSNWRIGEQLDRSTGEMVADLYALQLARTPAIIEEITEHLYVVVIPSAQRSIGVDAAKKAFEKAKRIAGHDERVERNIYRLQYEMDERDPHQDAIQVSEGFEDYPEIDADGNVKKTRPRLMELKEFRTMERERSPYSEREEKWRDTLDSDREEDWIKKLIKD